MAIAAHNATDRADQLIGVTERLTQLIRTEIDSLKTGQLNASSRDWEEKEKLAHAYRMEMAQIQQNPALLADAPPSIKDKLKNSVEIFREILEQHAVALAGMKEVTEGLVKAISEEVASSRAAPSGYGAAGQVSKPRNAAGAGIATDLKA